MRQLSSILLYLTLFFCLPAIAQDEHEATIYFLDGTDVSGYATLKFDKESFYGMPQDKILFRVSKEDKADTWDEKTVSKIVFHDFEFPRTFVYIPMVTFNVTEYYFLELISSGEVNLYADAMAAWNTKPGKDDEEGAHILPDEKYLKVKRDTETKLTSLGGSKKKIATYFNECPGIIERLNSNVFNTKTLEDIVEYYNDLCAGELADKEKNTKKDDDPDDN